MIDLTHRATISDLLSSHNARPIKSLGQHFLLRKEVIKKIISAADVSSTSTVLEIGPGLGVLTLELAQQAQQVIAVDTDATMIEIVSQNLTNEKLSNTTVIHKDILTCSPKELGLTNYRIVANLPYQITSPILWKYLHEETNKPVSMTIMIQREVADRINARPGSMSLLSVLAQYYAEVKKVVNVPARFFYPPPQVDSAVIHLSLKKQTETIDENKFFGLIKAGFANKRKMLKNNLREHINRTDQEIQNMLLASNLSVSVRAQELSVDEWKQLYKIVYTICT